MLRRVILGLFVLGTAAWAQVAPDEAAQAKVITDIQAAAQAYTRRLPNFICTQVTTREITLVNSDVLSGVRESSAGKGSVGRMVGTSPKSTDTFEEQLTYFARQENYQLLKVNGRKQAAGQPRPPGMSSTGEFATTLDAIFDPESKTQFEWKKWDTLRGQPVYVFAFRVDKSASQAQLEVPSSRVVVGYHGLVYADRETKMVLRLTTEAESPKEFPLQEVTHLLDYGNVDIGGRQFWLPLHGEMQTRMSEEFMRFGREGGHSRQVFMRNGVDFRGYRKYTADAQLKAEPDK